MKIRGTSRIEGNRSDLAIWIFVIMYLITLGGFAYFYFERKTSLRRHEPRGVVPRKRRWFKRPRTK